MKLKLVAVLLLVVLLLTGCGTKQAEISSLEDMKDMSLTVGLSDDIDGKAYILDVCPKAQIVAQNDVLYGVRSVSEGKIDAYVAGRIYLDTAMQEGSIGNVRVLDEPLHIYQCALGLSTLCDIPDYENTVNETLKRFISDGVIDEMHRYWFDEGHEALPDIKLDDDPAYILNAVTFGQCKPYSYFSNGELVGFDVELIYRVCAENHWGLELSHTEYPGMLMGLSTGKFDMISANLYVTDNREGNIAFSVPYNTEDISILVRDSSASGKESGRKLEYSTLEELNDAKVFGVAVGTIADTFISQRYPDTEVQIQYYPTVMDATLALVNGKVNAVVYDAPTLKYIESSTAGVGLMDELMANDDYHFIIRKSAEGEALRKEFDEWLAQQRENGEPERLRDFWCGSEEPAGVFDVASLPAVNGTLKIVTSASSRPDVYSYSGGLAGYPTELIYNFCRDRGYGAEVSIISFEGVIPALISGKADIVTGFISHTEERAQNVLYTDCILEGGVGVLVRSVDSAKNGSFLDTLKAGLYKTFVAEGRWKLIASGLGVTFIITAGGFLLANILGALFCACIMSRRRGLQILADVYDRIMQGTPIVVVLMILYYVVFGKSHISGVLVAVFGFGLASGASLARQFYGAISAVDRGQTEAALALGFTKLEAFTGIVLPQATRTALPGYFSEIIALMKGTAIVGYIAVTDLTKASDLIRSSTYDAFFPLLSVAIIYFLIAFGILSLLKFFQRRLAPKRVISKEAET